MYTSTSISTNKKRTISEENNIHRCWSCHKKKKCTYGPDPYREDLNADPRPVWECKKCRYQSMMDI